MRSFLTVVLLAATMFFGTGHALAQESPLIGKRAPDFTLERLSGKSASLSELIDGKKAILFFFATWCPHCREQLDDMAAKKAEFEKEGVVLALVDIGERKEMVAKFLQAHGVDNDAFLDVDSLASEDYKVLGIPTLVFVGADGKVRYVEYGLPENYLEILK